MLSDWFSQKSTTSREASQVHTDQVCTERFIGQVTTRLTVIVSHNIQFPFEGLGKIDQIYNLACPASPIQYQRDPLSTLKTCFLGTENLLELAKIRSIRILHTSTSGK